MKRAILILSSCRPAMFSKRSSTEGEQQTLAYPTGASLLGWAAGRGNYQKFSDPYSIFHSGRVRFSNGLPLAPSGRPAYPVPQILMEPKHERGGIIRKPDGQEHLAGQVLRVGRPFIKKDDKTVTSWEALKDFFVTRAFEVVRPALGARVRTGTHLGRAEDGKLFGYQHIRPGSQTRYVATIDAEGLSQEVWDCLLALFDGKTLSIGRSANVSYGGDYVCEVHDGLGFSVWPDEPVDMNKERLRLWVLSDLAMTDRWGNADFYPDGASFGLDDYELDAADSAITLRRYAPWNRTLRSRDIERQMIGSGSVLSFARRSDAPPSENSSRQLDNVFGLWREAGMGRVWINPPMLDVERGLNPKSEPDSPKMELSAFDMRSHSAVKPDDASSSHLTDWLKRDPSGQVTEQSQ